MLDLLSNDADNVHWPQSEHSDIKICKSEAVNDALVSFDAYVASVLL